MRSFACPSCSALVVFENSVCLNCSTDIGFRPATGDFVETAGYTRCAGQDIAGCNWVVEEGAGPLCVSCALTRTRPADDDPAGLAAYAVTEAAKRRLVYQLNDLGLPVVGRDADPVGGLAFDLLSSTNEPVVTGHASGIVTLDLAEGDDGHREQMRVELAEPYRTVLGHLRHETGHWYWEVLVDRAELAGTSRQHRAKLAAEFRRLFGDERADYGAALETHYAADPPADWAEHYVSTYATAHPWEDWAETFAHYLHIRDTSQTAAAYGVRVAGPQAPVRAADDLQAAPAEEPGSFDEIIADWLPLTYALNAVNRSMGLSDVYPFVLAPDVLAKLRYVHELVTAGAPYIPAEAAA